MNVTQTGQLDISKWDVGYGYWGEQGWMTAETSAKWTLETCTVWCNTLKAVFKYAGCDQWFDAKPNQGVTGKFYILIACEEETDKGVAGGIIGMGELRAFLEELFEWRGNPAVLRKVLFTLSEKRKERMAKKTLNAEKPKVTV